ncbi:hypothetical protein IV203_021155 [Nitzschia inconspicua]|uniref:Uncharacterized protein n=1 Tax=Nitzschia inconspicua TaxID=303405 RepID=A0A9K3PDP3_9STRA|nr:hypothetical protein IV203_021155 [Nitzschia inconspicua]
MIVISSLRCVALAGARRYSIMHPKTSQPTSLCQALLGSENRRLSSGRLPFMTSPLGEQDRQPPPTLLEILNAVESILAEGRYHERTAEACSHCRTEEENQENNENGRTGQETQ